MDDYLDAIPDMFCYLYDIGVTMTPDNSSNSALVPIIKMSGALGQRLNGKVYKNFHEKLLNIIDNAKDLDSHYIDDNYTPLIAAIEHNPKYVNALVNNGSNVNIRVGAQKITPLMYACNSEHINTEFKTVDILLKAGASPNLKDLSGHSLLFYMQNNINTASLDILIQNGIQISTEDFRYFKKNIPATLNHLDKKLQNYNLNKNLKKSLNNQLKKKNHKL